MAESRITVTPEKLRLALRVWMKVAPTRLWRDLEKQDKAAHDAPGSSADPLSRFDARNAVAEYVAEKVEQADWTITHPEPKNHGLRELTMAENAESPKPPPLSPSSRASEFFFGRIRRGLSRIAKIVRRIK